MTSRASAHAASRRDPLRLRHIDGGNPQKQCAPPRRGPGAIDMGEAHRVDRAGLRQVTGTPLEVRSWHATGTSRHVRFFDAVGVKAEVGRAGFMSTRPSITRREAAAYTV
jgi:hypothetical protein